MNAPKRLNKNLDLSIVEDRHNIVARGQLFCCDQHDFEVLYHGSLRKTLFGNQYLQADGNDLHVIARCAHCHREIVIFNSLTDGYDRCIDPIEQPAPSFDLDSYKCQKCSKKVFRVTLKYEYLSKAEIDDEGISDYENSFTWLWISLKCSHCGKEIKNFVDYETA